VCLHFFEGDVEADSIDDVVRQLPVVIEAALVLELLDLVVGGPGSTVAAMVSR
jgi:hypothetical protein